MGFSVFTASASFSRFVIFSNQISKFWPAPLPILSPNSTLLLSLFFLSLPSFGKFWTFQHSLQNLNS